MPMLFDALHQINRMCNDLDEHLRQLARKACEHPRGSLKRQQYLTQLVILVQQSGKLWRGANADRDCYQEALQETWLYICRNIESYDPQRASVITWINAWLQWRIRNISDKAMNERNQRVHPSFNHAGEVLDPIDHIAAPERPPNLSAISEEIQRWLQREKATLLRIHVRDRPDINCQVLILHRLPPAKTWEQLSQELGGVAIQTLCNFYNRECKPRLRQFLNSVDY